ncbi:MAG: PorT family protein [Tannerellaceae bacterium]|nr:PorT family protein [Tannerellaceae bacterium]
MKKTILLIMCLAMPLLTARAQGGLAFTPRAGLNLATIVPTSGGSLKPGLNFGFTADYMFNAQWGVETGLLYSMQGATFNQLSPSLDYLNIPLLLKFYFTDYLIESMGFYIVAGPQISLMAVMDKVGYTTDFEGKLMPDAITKPIDFGAVIGIGYELDTGLSFSANINWGLANIVNDSYKAYTTAGQATSEQVIQRDKAYTNLVFQLNFGYRFTL